MFFFFKQKTAYEMRISDWSSDVCSSDLCHDLEVRPAEPCLEPVECRHLLAAGSAPGGPDVEQDHLAPEVAKGERLSAAIREADLRQCARRVMQRHDGHAFLRCGRRTRSAARKAIDPLADAELFEQPDDRAGNRSEEHTSELQSLMRISYAV